MTAGRHGADALRGSHPEWSPWLAVVAEAADETESARWDAAVPEATGPVDGAAPRLAGATIIADRALVRRYVNRLFDTASRSGTPRMASLTAVNRAVDPMTLLAASIHRDVEQVRAIAIGCAVDADAFQAVAVLVAVPLLHASNRRWSPQPSWMQGHCPICGSWPAFAEVRGIERCRYLRCGGCGAEWLAQPLLCVFCGNTDHGDLRTLLPANADRAGAIEACRRCRGYLKVFTRLLGCSPAAVMLEDLASVDLDVAAIDAEYVRPAGLGCAINVTIEVARGGRFAWNA